MSELEDKIKRNNRNYKIAVAATISLLVGLSLLVGKWTQSNLQYWVDYYGKDADVPFWLSWLISVVLNVVIVGANLVSELLEIII